MIEKSKMSKFLEFISLYESCILILSYNISSFLLLALNETVLILLISKLIIFSVFSLNFFPFDLFLSVITVSVFVNELSLVCDVSSSKFEEFKSIKLKVFILDSFLI